MKHRALPCLSLHPQAWPRLGGVELPPSTPWPRRRQSGSELRSAFRLKAESTPSLHLHSHARPGVEVFKFCQVQEAHVETPSKERMRNVPWQFARLGEGDVQDEDACRSTERQRGRSQAATRWCTRGANRVALSNASSCTRPRAAACCGWQARRALQWPR